VKRTLSTLIAACVLCGAMAIAPRAMATDSGVDTDPPLKGPATAADWADFFEAVGEVQATLAQADELIHTRSIGSWRNDECRFQSLDEGLWTEREERLTAVCATHRWSVAGGLAKFMAVGSCESGWNRKASNGGSYLGLFQHAAGAYLSRIHAYDPPAWHHHLSLSWTNSRGQIVMTARMVHEQGWGAWTCA
jgi:hypothetical protein